MNLVELGKTVAKFAPILGEVIPLPGAALIGKAIGAAFGGDINDPDDLARRIENDPDAAIKLRQIAMDERLGVEQLAVEHIRLSNEDRANARQREIIVRDSTPAFIAKLFIAGYIGMLLVIILLLKFSTVNAFEEKILEMTIIGVSNAIMLILSYYFGANNKGP